MIMPYNTVVTADTEEAAEYIRNGELAAFPTETVYGLGADALDPEAVAKIFKAKGRPADNPLIVHLPDFSEAEKYAENIPDIAYRLAEDFCPGPFTIILKKRSIIPDITSGGLDTAGFRIPADETARKFLRECNTPVAAPSANISGSPSPTSAAHVLADMNGKIPVIIDGGSCTVGVESTVVSIENDTVKILRPGFVSAEDIQNAGFKAAVAKGVTEAVNNSEPVLSPGMKYKHYSPAADVTIIDGSLDKFIEYAAAHGTEKSLSMIFDRDSGKFPLPYISYGDTSGEQAQRLFSCLREADRLSADKLFVRCPSTNGVGLAVYNRLLRAAAFKVVKL